MNLEELKSEFLKKWLLLFVSEDTEIAFEQDLSHLISVAQQQANSLLNAMVINAKHWEDKCKVFEQPVQKECKPYCSHEFVQLENDGKYHCLNCHQETEREG
jgi:hypothetical protein